MLQVPVTTCSFLLNVNLILAWNKCFYLNSWFIIIITIIIIIIIIIIMDSSVVILNAKIPKKYTHGARA